MSARKRHSSLGIKPIRSRSRTKTRGRKTSTRPSPLSLHVSTGTQRQHTPTHLHTTMAPPEPRSTADRGPSTVYYNVKTTRPQPPPGSKSFSAHSHTYTSSVAHARSHSNSHSRSSTKPPSPMASPRGPLSVGQPYPPKLSPSATPRHHLTTPVSQLNAQSARTPSPNYFGLQVEASVDGNESGALPRENWSPASSSVKSFGAAIQPQQLPLDANPEYEAFRRQADANRGKSGFNLGSSHWGAGTPLAVGPSGAPVVRPLPPRWHTHGSEISTHLPPTRPSSHSVELGKAKEALTDKMDVDTDTNSTHDSAYVSSDSKRASEASMNPPSFLNLPRYESPAQFESPFEKRSGLSKVDDRHPRLSMIQGKADPPSPDPERGPKGPARSDTVPVTLDHGAPGMISPTQLSDLLAAPSKSEVLLLDLRVSPQYAQSRIKGALNLCIPTTLLKRATFNLQKLEQTFQMDSDKVAFGRWRETKHLVVYDAFSSEKRDAVSAMNTVKKFTNEGYSGVCSILRGGFNAFAAAYPALIDHGSTTEQRSGRPTLSLPGAAASGGGSGPSVAPVVGGVMLPSASNSTNAFFANIRQNQDLVDGVGQMDVKVPEGTDMEALPQWLKEAANVENHGKKVSDKFLNIEVEEQSRMKMAYSYINPMAAKTAQDPSQNVQLSGIEKGGKNRYKDILPFEHARVKLEGKPEGACDYVNASHIKASRSHKRYIASQGPLPATFEDFWSVIWDQDVRVIVMLTAESEGGQLKCHPYWNDREFGPIKLRALSEKKVSLDLDKQGSHTTMEPGHSGPTSTASGHQEDAFGFGAAMAAADIVRRRANTTTTLEASPQSQTQSRPKSTGETPYVIVRKFALSHAAQPFAPMREVTQLHYPSWPDFGTPAQPSHLLALVELANVMQRSSLPVDVPGALPSASPSRSENSPKQRLSPSPKKRSRSSSNLPLAWWEEPESEQATHPMLVHCSAGCGRTGTFCTVDSVIDMLKRQRIRNIRKANDNIERKVRGHKPRNDPDGDVAMAGLSFAASFLDAPRGTGPARSNPFDDAISPGTKSPKSPAFPNIATSRPKSISPSPPPSSSSDEDDGPNIDTLWIDDDTLDLIASTVHDFRCQRLSMVQTLRQFVLCYETVIEWVWRLQERGGPAGSAVGAPGTGAGGTAAMRARGRSGTVAHAGTSSK